MHRFFLIVFLLFGLGISGLALRQQLGIARLAGEITHPYETQVPASDDSEADAV